MAHVVKSTTFQTLHKREAREALYNFVRTNCWYVKKAAHQMHITFIETTTAYHYKLESWTESRTTEWKTIPVEQGEKIPKVGTIPNEWEVEVDRPEPFEDIVQDLEVPKSASLENCNKCDGKGRRKCFRCDGGGRQRNIRDNTSSTCLKCSGTGLETCRYCNGEGVQRRYLELIIEWKTRMDECIIQSSRLPYDKILKAEGKIVFKDQLAKVGPLDQFDEKGLKAASIQLIQKHKKKAKGKLILQQRHQVRIIPISEVHYEWKNTADSFIVYGLDDRVYAPNYPRRCCGFCSCTIL